MPSTHETQNIPAQIRELYAVALNDVRYVTDVNFFYRVNNLIKFEDLHGAVLNTLCTYASLKKILESKGATPSSLEMTRAQPIIDKPQSQASRIPLKKFFIELAKNDMTLPNDRVLQIITNMAIALQNHYQGHQGSIHQHVNLCNLCINPLTDEVELIPPEKVEKKNSNTKNKRNAYYVYEVPHQKYDVYALGVCIGELLQLGSVHKVEIQDVSMQNFRLVPQEDLGQRKLSPENLLILHQYYELLDKWIFENKYKEFRAQKQKGTRKHVEFLNEFVTELRRIPQALKRNFATSAALTNPSNDIVVIHYGKVSSLDTATKQYLLSCTEVKIHVPKNKGDQAKYQKMLAQLQAIGIKATGIVEADPKVKGRKQKIIKICQCLDRQITDHDKPYIYRYLTNKRFTPAQELGLYEAGINLSLETSAKATVQHFNAALRGLFKEEEKLAEALTFIKDDSTRKVYTDKMKVLRQARLALGVHFRQDHLTQKMMFDILSSAQNQMLNPSSFRNTLSQMFGFFGVRAFTSQEEKNINELKQKVLRS